LNDILFIYRGLAGRYYVNLCSHYVQFAIGPFMGDSLESEIARFFDRIDTFSLEDVSTIILFNKDMESEVPYKLARNRAIKVIENEFVNNNQFMDCCESIAASYI
jgi:hypothetical protein